MEKRLFTEIIQEAPDSPNFRRQVERLSTKYEYWRDVPADGNCFYRSIAYSLLDHFLSPSTPLSDFEMFYKRLRWQELTLPDERITDYFLVISVLFHLLQAKQQPGNTDFSSKIDTLMQSDAFVKPLIRVLRNLTYQSILTFKPEGLFYPGCEDEYRENLRFGQQSGEVDYIGLSSALEVTITVVTLGKSDYSETVHDFPSRRNTEPNALCLHTALISGHFHSLYAKSSP